MFGFGWKHLAAILCVLAVFLAVFLGLGWGVRQYGNSRVAAQELGSVKGAVQEAVQARASAVKADVKTANVKAVVAQDMRLVGISARKEMNAVFVSETIARDCVGPVHYSVLNSAISEGNRAIESTR